MNARAYPTASPKATLHELLDITADTYVHLEAMDRLFRILEIREDVTPDKAAFLMDHARAFLEALYERGTDALLTVIQADTQAADRRDAAVMRTFAASRPNVPNATRRRLMAFGLEDAAPKAGQARGRTDIPADGYIRLAEVQALVPFSRATIWRKVQSGEFPAPFKLSERVTAWRRQDILDWLEGVEEASRAKKSPEAATTGL